MKKLYSRKLWTVLFCCIAAMLSANVAYSQASTVTTTAAFLNNNGNGTVTFNFENTNGYDVIITGIDGVTGSSGSLAVEFWYKNTPLAGAPGAISVVNGWTQVAASTITGIPNTTTTVTQNFFSGLNFIVPAGQTYAFAVYAAGQRYYTMVAPYLPTATFSAGGCNIVTGQNIGYGGGTPPATPPNTPRGWIGSITFNPNGLCFNPPIPGNVTSTANPACPNTNFTLSLSGGNNGIGQSYQWEISPNNVTWTPIAGATSAVLTTSQVSSNYYHCIVTCGVSVTSSSLQVITNSTPLSGTYTINSASPTLGTNFQTFNDLAAALTCGGLSGPVIVNVVTGSGPYNEQVELPQIGGATSVNTLTINGNGETLTYGASLAAAPHTLALNGTDFIKINDLNIVGTGATYALTCHLWNNADNNKLNNCTFTCPANGAASTQVPFSISGTAISGIATGPAGSNDTIQGCTMNSGYYNTCIVGNSGAINTGNVLTGCTLKDFYFYGSYNTYNNGTVISYNTIERPTRTTLSTFYGVYISTSCVGILANGNRIRHSFGAAPTNGGATYAVYCSVDGTAGNENKIINNLISDINSAGIIYGLYLLGADYVKAYHNTISLDNASSTATGATYGIYSTGTVGGIDIENNIITITRGGTGTKYGLYFTGGTQISNYNNIYVNAPAGTNSVGNFAAVNYTTLANWQTANGGIWDQQSMSVDPIYTSPVTNDYTPTNLILNNQGTGVGVATDIVLFPRLVSTPDMGAYEYANASTDLSLIALVSPDNSGCYSATQNVTVTLQNYGITAIDFSLTPASVNCNVTGALVTSLTNIINTGTLAPNSTMNFTFSTQINMTANGTYNFSCWATLPGDGNVGNDTLTPAPSLTVGLVAGSITVSLPNICVSGNPVITLTGNYGGSIQWKESTVSPTGPWTNVGTGLNTYTPGTVTQTTFYKVFVTCNTNTDSTAADTAVVNNPAILTTTTDTVCAGTSATIAATGTPGSTIKWYTLPTGGTALYTGSPYITGMLPGNVTYYAEASTGGGGGTASPLLVTEMDLGGSDILEIQNVSPDPLNVTGWTVYLSNSYTDITLVNTISQTLSGTLNPGAILTWTDAAAGPNYWGNNILWNPGAFPTFTGWAAIVDNNNVLRDIAFMNWPAANIAAANIIMGGNSYAVGNFWSGPGVDITNVPATNGVARIGTSDNNTLSDFATPLLSTGSTNPQMTLPFTGFGCAGSRVGVNILVDPSPVITATPAAATVCETSGLTLTGGGAGAGGTYAWTGGVTDGVQFPATTSTVYTVTGTSANGCSNTAISDITVNPVLTGTATVSPTPICLGGNSTFSGSIATICGPNVNGFAGIYAPANWVYSTNNSNGTVNTGGAPANIIITTGSNGTGQYGTTNYTKTIGCAGTVNFNWGYAHPDAFGAVFDYPAYSVNGGPETVFSSFNNGGSNVQNGVQSIAVNAGDVLELRAVTIDNDVSYGTITISSLSAPAAPIGGTVSFWDQATGGINMGNSPVNVTPVTAGTLTYYAEYTAMGTGCVNPVRDPVTLTINGLPTITANPSMQTVCENGMATVAGGGGVSYTWTGGVIDNTPFVVTAPDTYIVTGTDGNGCTNTATAMVMMNNAPVVTAGATPSTTCNNTSVTPNGTGPNLVWSGGLTNGTPFIATATNTYTVTGTDGVGCSATSSVTVTVNPASGVLAPATSNQSQTHGDDFDIDYYDGSCDLIATVDDGAGGNVLGLTTSTVNVDATANFHNGQPFVRRWYQITPTSNGSADVVIYINQSDFDDYNSVVLPPYLMMPTSGNNSDPNIPNIRITKNDDAGLGNNPIVITPAVNWNGNYWELSFNTPSFSQFRVHSVNPGNVPLPVVLTNFDGKKLESTDELTWTTGSEQNNAYFNLQHSTDGVNFATIAKVNSKAINGNSATPLNYNAINSHPVLGHNYYRLQQVDIDNKASIHAKIVDLIWGANGSTVNIYPNPTRDILNIDLYTTKVQNTTVKVLDMSGRIIKQVQAKSVAGMNNITISLGEFASGLYTVQVYENDKLMQTGKVRKND